jgi:cytidine deaminase
MTYKRLVTIARNARRNSYSPYSKFRVGSALLAKDGKVFTGCNIENSSFGLTICAERTAIFKAVSEGYTRFKAIAIATDKNEFIAPCGACRQVIADLAGDIDFIMSNKRGALMVMKVSEMLPFPFGPKNLRKRKTGRA